MDKYLNLAKELKNIWNMKVNIIPIVVGAFGTVTKGLLKGLEDLARIWRRFLETWRDLLSLKLRWKTIS